MHNTSTGKTKQEHNSNFCDYSKVYERIEELEQDCKSQLLTSPLQREAPPPKPFPMDALGDILGGAAKRLYEIVKAPDSICGQSILAAAALLTQPFVDVHIDGRKHPISLFLLTAAESGERKSAVDNIVLKSIREYEDMLAKANFDEKRLYRNKMEFWKRQKEQILKHSSSIKFEEELCKLGKEPMPPLEPFLLLEEPSYEGLVKLFAIGQPSMGLFSDEGGRMFGGYAMGEANILKTACGLSSLWDGKPITRIRGGDENLLLNGRRFSAHLMVQEVVLHSILKNELLVGQGLIARCLIVSPLPNAGNRKYNPIDISKEPLINRFHETAFSLLDQPFPLKNPEILNELSPRALSLSPSAKETWIRFHDDIDASLKKDGLYYAIRRTANKAAEQALRIAAVLTIFEDFEASCISLDLIDRGIALTRFYLEEAIRIVDSSAHDPDLDLAQALLNWMESKTKETGSDKVFTLQEIYQRGGPRGVRTVDAAKKVIKILETHRIVYRPDASKEVWKLTGYSSETKVTC